LENSLPDEKLRDIIRAVFDDKEQTDSFVNSYLNERGMYEPEPDAEYSYDEFLVQYYTNEEIRKTAFILRQGFGRYFLHCITMSWDDLSEVGTKVYKYDEQGRAAYKTYYVTHGSHSCFYMYEGDSKTPWAYIETGGISKSGDDVSDYGFGVSVYLFKPVDGADLQN
jgi:hypothetical protein